MDDAEQTRIPGPSATGPMIRTLGGIAMLSGFLVVLAYQLSLPAIQRNQREATERAVFQVLPGAVSRKDFVLEPQGLVPAAKTDGRGILVHAAYDAQGKLKGVALEAAAQGYQDVIRLVYGYDPGCRCITGIHVLKMTETPGLGDRIATDPGFLANFKALAAKIAPGGTALLHPIRTVKHGTKKNPWEIDAISGATISSKAVGRALNDSAEAALPALAAQLQALQEKP